MIDVKTIEKEFKTVHKTNKIDKKSKKWKTFLTEFRKVEKLGNALPTEEVKVELDGLEIQEEEADLLLDDEEPIENAKKVEKKERKKKEAPESFVYNNYTFKRVKLKQQDDEFVKSERKIHFDEGFYTKVIRYQDKPYLFISEEKRPVKSKPKLKNVKSK